MQCDLADAPLRTPLTLVDVGRDPGAAHRLATLGLRVGTIFSLVQRTAGGGRIAQVSGTRIALGRALVRDLTAEVAA